MPGDCSFQRHQLPRTSGEPTDSWAASAAVLKSGPEQGAAYTTYSAPPQSTAPAHLAVHWAAWKVCGRWRNNFTARQASTAPATFFHLFEGAKMFPDFSSKASSSSGRHQLPHLSPPLNYQTFQGAPHPWLHLFPPQLISWAAPS